MEAKIILEAKSAKLDCRETKRFHISDKLSLLLYSSAFQDQVCCIVNGCIKSIYFWETAKSAVTTRNENCWITSFAQSMSLRH